MDSEDSKNLIVIVTSGEHTTFCVVPASCPVSISGITRVIDRILTAIRSPRKSSISKEQAFLKQLSVEYNSWLKEKNSDFSPENEGFSSLLQKYNIKQGEESKAELYRRAIVVSISLPIVSPKPEMYIFQQNELEAFKDLLKKSNKMIINISGTWCPPCKRIYPTFVELAKGHHSSDVTFVRFLITSFSPEVQNMFRCELIPTFAFAEGGEINHSLTFQSSEADFVKNAVFKFLKEKH